MEERDVLHWQATGENLHSFLHDSELMGFEFDPADRRARLSFKIYLREEVTAPQNLEVKFQGVRHVHTSVMKDGPEVSVEFDQFVTSDPFGYCWEAKLDKADGLYFFEMIGDGNIRIQIASKDIEWLTDKGQTTLEALLVTERRQWDMSLSQSND